MLFVFIVCRVCLIYYYPLFCAHSRLASFFRSISLCPERVFTVRPAAPLHCCHCLSSLFLEFGKCSTWRNLKRNQLKDLPAATWQRMCEFRALSRPSALPEDQSASVSSLVFSLFRCFAVSVLFSFFGVCSFPISSSYDFLSNVTCRIWGPTSR